MKRSPVKAVALFFFFLFPQFCSVFIFLKAAPLAQIGSGFCLSAGPPIVRTASVELACSCAWTPCARLWERVTARRLRPWPRRLP